MVPEAGEITAEIAPASVEVRLRAGEPEIVVTGPAEEASGGGPAPLPPAADTGTATRINLRLPDALKARAETAAAAAGLSLSAWLVRAVAASLDPGAAADRRPGRFTGWVR
jgi:hypothetical protein